MDTDTVMMEKCEDPRPASPAPAAAAPGRGSPWAGLGAETRERQRPGAGQHNTLTHLLQQHNGAATMVRTVSSWDRGSRLQIWYRTYNDAYIVGAGAGAGMISCYPLPISRRRLSGNAGQCGPPPTAPCLFSRTSLSNVDLLHHINIYRQPVRFSYILQHPVHIIFTYLPPTYLSTYLPKASTDCPFTDLMGRSVTIAKNNPGPLCHDTDQ